MTATTTLTFESVKPGDIVYVDVGYNMSLPHFFMVVDKTGTLSVLINELDNKFVSGNIMDGEVVPDMNSKMTGEIFKTRFSKYGLKIKGHYAVPFTGKPLYYSCLD